MIVFNEQVVDTVRSNNYNGENIQILNKIEYYSNYWTNHYKLYNYTDPTTNKPISNNLINNISIRMIWQESKFIAKSKSWEKKLNCYSYGLSRLIVNTAKNDLGWEIKNEEELYDVDKNIKYGIKNLCKQIKRYNGNIEKGIAAYNAGGAYTSVTCNETLDSCEIKYINQNYVDIVFYNKYDLPEIE
jgi:soluble lytic murein transglycosylase-like protein